MTAYYNENDSFAAAWLRALIADKVIADGEVDERSIEEVQPEDLRGFTQCHFFAGIGVWSHALRLAGWPDDRPVWTGSCPCPSFSAAGQGKGFDDPRHLWPAWARLIYECKPPTIFGEQVDDAIGHGWLDVVQTDLERADYAVGKAVFGACSVGAPQISSRLYFVAEAASSRRQETREHGSGQSLVSPRPEQCGGVGVLAEAERERIRAKGSGGAESQASGVQGPDGKRERLRNDIGECIETRSMAASDGRQSGDGDLQRSGQHGLFAQDGGIGGVGASERQGPQRRLPRRENQVAGNGESGQDFGCAGAVSGFWADAEWLYCTDGKYRPVEPGTFPLAHGIANRVGLLRGYGNAIVAPQAQAFIEAAMEVISIGGKTR